MIEKVSIAVIYHNEEKNLPALLESFSFLQNQTAKIDLIFIDNKSLDRSGQLVEQWRKENTQFQLQHVRREKNHLAEARQQALELSQRDWVMFLDADSQIDSEWLDHFEVSLKEYSEQVVALGGAVQPMETQTWHQYITPLIQVFPLEGPRTQKVFVKHLPTNNCAFHRQTCLEVGGFHPYFAKVGEDLDLSVRLQSRGKTLYDPNFAVKHGLPEHESQWFRKMAFYGRAQSFVFLKNRGGLPWEKFIPLFLVLFSVIFLWIQPLLIFLFLIPWLIIPRARLIILTFLFYGLGQWVGAVIYTLDILRGLAPKSDRQLANSKPF